MKTPSRRTPVPNTPSPEDIASAREQHRAPPHRRSPTAIAAEVARTGLPHDAPITHDAALPGEDDLRAGDPDVDPLDVEYSGEEIPGGGTPTPDQNDVDEVGQAYGQADDPTEGIVSTEERLGRRDRHRWEMDPRSKDSEP